MGPHTLYNKDSTNTRTGSVVYSPCQYSASTKLSRFWDIENAVFWHIPNPIGPLTGSEVHENKTR